MLRQKATAIFEAGLVRMEPSRLVEDIALPSPAGSGRLLVFGAGKASAHLAAGLEGRLGSRDYTGRVLVKHGHGATVSRLSVEEGGHPLPDAAGLEATARLRHDLTNTHADDRVVFLLTGGASAVLVAPADGLSLEDKVSVTELLLRSGATIQELNAVRKHLSAVKGGRLLEQLLPARVLTLVVSDVIGNDLSSIGSGPTTADPSTFEEAVAILDGYHLSDEAPKRVMRHLREGVRGVISETPKPGAAALDNAEHIILGSNRDLVAAARAAASALGFDVEIFADDLVGPVHERARAFAKALRECQKRPEPVALIAGGELTLEVTGSGLGGRSQEFALVTARELRGASGVGVLAAGSDGTDGPTDAAGAFADGGTWARGREAGLEPQDYLANNDAYPFFDALGALLKTGPTGTNVNDLMIGLTQGAAVSLAKS